MSSTPVSPATRPSRGSVLLQVGLAALAVALLFWHVTEWQWRDPGAARWWTVGLMSAAWWVLLAFCYRKPSARQREVLHPLPLADSPRPQVQPDVELIDQARALTVVYASQTGVAEQLATKTLQGLQQAGRSVRLLAMNDVALDALREGRVLFVVSTTGEGEPPDMAAGFHAKHMRHSADLSGLRYGLLALGDSDYEDYCGFGRELRQWLQASGAQAMFDPVEVDREDEGALRHWQHHLAMLSGDVDMPDWQSPRYASWPLAERRLLNPGSVGEACFHLALTPPATGAHWDAGDLAEIGPCHPVEAITQWLAWHGLDGDVAVTVDGERQPLRYWLQRCHLPEANEVVGFDEAALAATLQVLPHRTYSIASLPQDGAIHLLVRQMRGMGGYLGLGSGWLTEHAALGAAVALRIRRNTAFHAPTDDRPLILIGNGTGLAALRALLKARIAAGRRRNWLLFGERHQAHDFYYRDELETWLGDGWIERLDLAWSRDQAERIYVQQRLLEAADSLRAWVDDGAAIYVCGSLDGMAPGVDGALNQVLGHARVEQLREQGRYRRDVY